MADGEGKLYSAITVFLQEREEKLRQLAEKYPDDIPNEACNHAFICGISIENSFHPKVGDFNYLFSIGCEDLYVWTYKKDTNSALVSVVNPSVKEEPFWKTSGRIVQLAFSFVEAFESIEDPTEYRWMYFFNPEVSTIDEVVFYNLTEFERISLSNGRIYKATDIARLASIIDLLERDDRAYNALSLVHSAFNLHWCCLTCELSSHPYHDHLATEPKLWNQADRLQNIEMSIVQSCRAVESILGEPPNRKKASSVIRHKDKWKAEIGIDPDEPFEKAGKSYLDFYYELFFNLRNPSAHSYGNIHYDLQRKMAVAAQCFAAIVLREYIYKHELPNEAALEKLRFNVSVKCPAGLHLSTSHERMKRDAHRLPSSRCESMSVPAFMPGSVPSTARKSYGLGGIEMGELTIQGAQAQRNLLEWSRRVAECRSSGLSVTRWCAEHDIKPKTYYNWQKKVFAAMLEQQRQMEEAREPERRFVEVPAPSVQNDLVATFRIGEASLDVYSGASAEVLAVLCKVLSNVK